MNTGRARAPREVANRRISELFPIPGVPLIKQVWYPAPPTRLQIASSSPSSTSRATNGCGRASRPEGVSRLGLEPHPRAVHPVGEFRAGALVESLQRLCHTDRRYLTLAQGGEVRRQLREQLNVLFPAR